jgi:hypothetical protein
MNLEFTFAGRCSFFSLTNTLQYLCPCFQPWLC